MTELHNIEHELRRFRTRIWAAALFVLFGFSLLVMRLVHLQVDKHQELSTQAENNRIAVLPIVPNRGLILDRNGVELAKNYSAYTLEITPGKSVDLDATIDELSEVIEIHARDRKRFRRLLEDSKNFDSVPLRTKLTDEEVARFTAQRYRFPGVEVKARLFRQYPLGELGSHVIGYIGRINQSEKEKLEGSEDEANYRGTNHIGKLGIEQSYERELHGEAGYEEVETSAGGRAVRRIKSSPPAPGNTLVLSIDIKLQALVETLFGDRRGALVAMDPRTGEVLAFVSKPTFDPNLFVDGIDTESWRELNESIDKPLLNRALRGTYPPGSTYKPFMAMAALRTGKRSPGDITYDNGNYQFGNHTFRSHGDGGPGPVDMTRSIVKSSNVYYYALANDLGVDAIHEQLWPFAFGRETGIDIKGEVTGDLPSTTWKRQKYKRPDQQRWYAGETISLGIGQGYNNFTMLQMASAMSTLVSGGQRFKPRLVREVQDVVTGDRKTLSSNTISPLDLKPEHVAVITKAMHGVTKEGTSTRVFLGAPYATGGKTGTAQAVGVKQNEKYNASKLEEHKRDHSLYIAFAPLESPSIALAVVVENAGFGAAAAAPIARRVFDYNLLGLYPSEEDIALTREGKSAAPIGKPRPAASIVLPGAGDVLARDVMMNTEAVAAVAAAAAASATPPAAPAPSASSVQRPVATQSAPSTAPPRRAPAPALAVPGTVPSTTPAAAAPGPAVTRTGLRP
ncbi:MAG: penicillin-binding protein 2 [Pseudomonadota bacterium]